MVAFFARRGGLLSHGPKPRFHRTAPASEAGMPLPAVLRPLASRPVSTVRNPNTAKPPIQ